MSRSSAEPIVVLMTAASTEEANRLAEMLVSKKLAACVQILPEMTSVYAWKGEVARDQEILLLARTVRANFAELERETRAIHSYETPEIIALSITEGSEGYLKWLADFCEAS